MTRSNHPCLWLITWDPSQPVATRPLAIQKDGTWYTYGWDLTKNICELYSTGGTLTTAYSYSPFGQVTATGSVTQPIQWSSEVWDSELGLVYYNWRYCNTVGGRWNGRDSKKEGFSGNNNLYDFLNNSAVNQVDIIGEAYLAKRPLQALMWRSTARSWACIAPFVSINSEKGLETNHSHFFFKDGRNIGYFDSPKGGELRADDAPWDIISLYVVVRDNLDDEILDKAISETPARRYSLFRIPVRARLVQCPGGEPILVYEYEEKDNCNTWANRVLQKYDMLVNSAK